MDRYSREEFPLLARDLAQARARRRARQAATARWALLVLIGSYLVIFALGFGLGLWIGGLR
ncbi:hypothetical protein [Nocardia sp. IFM 10818]